jgi:DNA-binding MarR family transcriptional regulator
MSGRYPQLDLDEQICFPLYAATRAVVRAYGPLLEAVGLTYPQYLTMLALWGSPEAPLTVGELGRRLRLDTGTLTPLLKRLELLGHLRRLRDPVDERRVLLEVSDQGWALRDRVAHVPAELFRSVDLGHDEVAELRRVLTHVIERLDGHAGG